MPSMPRIPLPQCCRFGRFLCPRVARSRSAQLCRNGTSIAGIDITPSMKSTDTYQRKLWISVSSLCKISWKFFCSVYTRYCNPDRRHVHAYITIGAIAWFVAIGIPVPRDVETGLIFATIIFSFHAYIEERIQYLLNLLSDRWGKDNWKPVTSTPLVVVLVACVDIMVAVPMYSYSQYADTFAFNIFVLVMYFLLLIEMIRGIRSADNYFGRRIVSGTIVVVTGIYVLFVSLFVIVFTYPENTIRVLYQISPVSLPDPTILMFYLIMIFILFFILSTFLLFPILIPGIILFFTVFLIIILPVSLLIGDNYGMSLFLRQWSVISIGLIYLIVGLPHLLSWLDEDEKPQDSAD